MHGELPTCTLNQLYSQKHPRSCIDLCVSARGVGTAVSQYEAISTRFVLGMPIARTELYPVAREAE